MRACPDRAAALALLRKYNQEHFHIQHALTVEAVMRWYAENLGHGDEADFWATVGLLHDVDFEQWPEEHCKKAPELLSEIGCGEDFIHAVCSHGYGLCSDVEPTEEMEKVLFAADELTGLIGAAALMRPSKSCQDMEVSSLKKKFKDKKFAAGCSRDVIREGAEQLGWPLEELMDKTLQAMRAPRTRHRRRHEGPVKTVKKPPGTAGSFFYCRSSAEQLHRAPHTRARAMQVLMTRAWVENSCRSSEPKADQHRVKEKPITASSRANSSSATGCPAYTGST